MLSANMCWNSALAVARRAGAKRRVRACTGGPDVTTWCSTRWRIGKSYWQGRVTAGKSDSTAVYSGPRLGGVMMCMLLGAVCVVSIHAFVNMWVDVSCKRLLCMSTCRLKLSRKSVPRIGMVTSATTKMKGRLRRKPRSRVRDRRPYVRMEDPLAALKEH